MDFINKVCVITGGAKGIGLHIARGFYGKGARLAVIDLDKEALNSLGSEMPGALLYHGDIADESVLEGFSDEVLRCYGTVDYLINNACLTRKGLLSNCSFDDFNYVMRVGVTAPYFLSKAFMEHFNEGGAIVNISSTRAFMSQKDTESYTAAKGGITALTHGLAVSLAGSVRVNSVSPGWIDCGCEESHPEADEQQHLVKRVGKPSDIVNAVMFLCHPENGFITGQNFTVDGGMTKLMIYHGEEGWDFNS